MNAITTFFSNVSINTLTIVVMLDALSMLLLPLTMEMACSLSCAFLKRYKDKLSFTVIGVLMPIVAALPSMSISLAIFAAICYVSTWQTIVVVFFMWVIYGQMVRIAVKDVRDTYVETFLKRVTAAMA